MSEALQSFLVSASCIVGVAILIPCVELIASRFLRDRTPTETPEVVRLTPSRTPRRSGF
jgi:hypothetical protein